MSDISLAAKPAAVPFVPVATTPTARSRDVFLPSDSRRQSRFGALRRRLRWPLGIYTTPVLILMVWEILGRTGILTPTYAPPPTDIAEHSGAAVARRHARPRPGNLIAARGDRSRDRVERRHRDWGARRVPAHAASTYSTVWHRSSTRSRCSRCCPCSIVWFGIDELTKVLLIAFGAGVPMYLNLFAAIRGVDQRLIEMARTTGAGPWRIVSRVLLPGALPGFLVGLRFSLAYSVLGLVAAETVNADQGLGFLVTQAQTYLQTNQVFVGLVIYSILGLLADQFVRVLERVLLRWRPSYEAI